MAKLTSKQELFCKEYLIDLNATQAAIRSGYSKNNPGKIGPELLAKPQIAKKIQECMDKRSKRVEVTADEVLRELLLIAKADLVKIYNEDGSLKSIHEIPEETRRAIASVEVYKDFTEGVEIGETKKIKFWDKPRALELLGRHLKIFTDKVEHSGTLSWEQKVMDSLKDENGGNPKA